MDGPPQEDLKRESRREDTGDNVPGEEEARTRAGECGARDVQRDTKASGPRSQHRSVGSWVFKGHTGMIPFHHNTDSSSTIAIFGIIGTLFGAFIGGCFGYFTAKLQLDKTRELDENRRLFDVRKESYERAFIQLTFAQSERNKGKVYPNNADQAMEVHRTIGSITLWASTELMSQLRRFFGFLASPIPTVESEKKKDSATGFDLIQKLIDQMRKDIGSGNVIRIPSVEERPE